MCGITISRSSITLRIHRYASSRFNKIKKAICDFTDENCIYPTRQIPEVLTKRHPYDICIDSDTFSAFCFREKPFSIYETQSNPSSFV